MGKYFDLYSRRQEKRERAGQPIIYQYDTLPEPFRVQVVLIWRKAIGDYAQPIELGVPPISVNTWNLIFEVYRFSVGKFYFMNASVNPASQIERLFLETDTKEALDIIDLSFHVIHHHLDVLDLGYRTVYNLNHLYQPGVAIELLNRQFEEHSIGYKFIEGELVQKTDQFLFSEVTEPAIRLLHEMDFRGASDEFMNAHRHYRQREYKEAMYEALKAVESTLKTICGRRDWGCSPTAPAKELMEIIFAKGLIPTYLGSSKGSLLALMEGIATVRNKNGSHGQGEEIVDVPEHLAAYILHLAGANIVLLVEAHKALPI